MTHGSTEVYLALQHALRRQTPIQIHFPQTPAAAGRVTGVSHTYADISCRLDAPVDSQLSLVRISFPFRDAIFSFSTTARRLSPTQLRIETDTSGERSALQQWSGIPVSASPPFTAPARPQLHRLHGMLQQIRQLIMPLGEHRISIKPKPQNDAGSQYGIVVRAALHQPPADFCLPILPAPADSRFDITAPIAYNGISFGSIDIIHAHATEQSFPALLTRLSTCCVAIAHELLQPDQKVRLYPLSDSPFGTLLFSYGPIDTSKAGFQLTTPTGCCFTVPRQGLSFADSAGTFDT
ncbi:hypothetical protein [Spirochaeta africana]|uniref:Uncharacterized protein n=1 Tax=Spirochaeta africana (strain ATCC 700263 / DSM 8902 / Z-7692) TaxID=889378 RepID=H9UHS1_SPIAZ|nr:hypothetical protein [Spirochaeta africana]AFG37064.1 hypothetical protein Spiaf_0976 [Spirochaeta africana DSM 8902]